MVIQDMAYMHNALIIESLEQIEILWMGLVQFICVEQNALIVIKQDLLISMRFMVLMQAVGFIIALDYKIS